MHYTTYVLVPRNTDAKCIESEVLSLMHPYCEENEGKKTRICCWCVKNQFSRKLLELIERDFGEPGDLWKRRMDEKGGNGNGEAVWRDVVREYNNFVDAQSAKFLENSPPDPDCDVCGGTGWGTTTFDFDTRWDFWGWEVSDEILKGEELDPEKQDETQPRVYDLRDIDVSRIVLPYAILSPEGWDQCKEWTRSVRDFYLPDELWRKMVHRIVDKYKEDYLLIPVDCHV
ncbi:MAG: hypothetical protein ACLP5H_10470 [Desulfomonilaceae bacterium]